MSLCNKHPILQWSKRQKRCTCTMAGGGRKCVLSKGVLLLLVRAAARRRWVLATVRIRQEPQLHYGAARAMCARSEPSVCLVNKRSAGFWNHAPANLGGGHTASSIALRGAAVRMVCVAFAGWMHLYSLPKFVCNGCLAGPQTKTTYCLGCHVTVAAIFGRE